MLDDAGEGCVDGAIEVPGQGVRATAKAMFDV
jgi:hypothetical protein